MRRSMLRSLCLRFWKKLALTTALLATFSPGASLAQWQPSKPVEFVLPGAPGGAGDMALRKMIEIINAHKLGAITLTPVYKPGGSGEEAFGHFAKADPNHTLMLSSKVFYIAPLRKRELGVDITLFTPVATMGADVLVLWVPGDRTDINTFADFVKVVKAKTAKGESWTMAGTGEDSEDRLITNFLNASYKLNIKYAGFPSGGEPASQLAAKKADSAINTVAEQKQYAASGKSRPIVVFSGERLPHLPNTPALSESGDRFAHELQRAISGPPNMTMDAQIYYARLFRKVYDSQEWRTYRDENSLSGKFLSGPGLIEYWQAQLGVRRSMLAVIDVFQGINTPTSARVR